MSTTARKAAVATAIALGCLATLTSCGTEPGEKQEIVVFELNWESASIQAHIAAWVIEHGFEYPVRTIQGDTIAGFPALQSGSAHVIMEVWLPNQRESYDKMIGEGSATDLGSSLDDPWQGFAIPQYVKEAHPGLVSVTDIPQYMDVFSSAATQGKVRFIDCVPGWVCETINGEKFAGYGLEDSLYLIKPGSEAALIADLSHQYINESPWMGYIWGPSELSVEFDMYVLEEPEYTPECWSTNKACSYPISEVKVLAVSEIIRTAPDVAEFLRRWHFGVEEQIEVTEWMRTTNRLPEEAAEYYFATYPNVWKAFVPADVAARLEVAVEQGEIAAELN